MSEVQKILKALRFGVKPVSYGWNDHDQKKVREAEQAIYDLLMEKAIDYDLVTAIPVSAINALFGRTE